MPPLEMEQGGGGVGDSLLLLWAVVYEQAYPSDAQETALVALLHFTRRLQHWMEADPTLQLWMLSKDMQCPRIPGVAASHRLCWLPPPLLVRHGGPMYSRAGIRNYVSDGMAGLRGRAGSTYGTRERARSPGPSPCG
jgi:hypothetical protein